MSTTVKSLRAMTIEQFAVSTMTITQLANSIRQAPIVVTTQVGEDLRYAFKFYRCGHVSYQEEQGTIHTGFNVSHPWQRVSRNEFLSEADDKPFMVEAIAKFEATREYHILYRYKSFGWELPNYTK